MPSAFRPKLSARTERLNIRPFQADDFEAWIRANEERLPKQSAFDGDPRPPEQRNRRFFGRWIRGQHKQARADGLYTFALFDRARDRLVGFVNVQVMARHRCQLGWIGYGIYNHEWRKGYGAEGVRRVLTLAFHELALHRIEAGIRPENRASAKVARSVGMKKVSRTTLYVEDRWAPLDVYATEAEDWGVRDTRPRVGAELAGW